jgi:putative ABC transport system permease protein
LVGRLKPGITVEQARADLDTVSERLQKQYPETNAGNWVDVRPLRDQVIGDVRPALYILFGGVVCLLLIACGNVANLLLSLSRSRTREFAVRSALGASRGRLLRQLLTESILLSLAGGAMGVLLAAWATAAASHLSSDTLPRAAGIHINGMVLAFTVAVSVLTGIIFGCAPAIQGAAADVNDALKQSSPSAVGGRHQRLHGVFVVIQLAMSLVLLVAAGLLIRSFTRVLRVDLGFNPHDVVSAVIVVPESHFSKVRPTEEFFEEALRNIEHIPGVTSAATITPLPLLGNEWDTGVKPEGLAKPSQGWPETDIHYISPDYLKTMQVSLLSGRNFTAADNEDAQEVVLVNREFVRRFWPGRDPLGLTLRLGGRQLDGPPDDQSSVRTVIGMVEDVHQYGLDQPVVPEVYMPTSQGLRNRPLQRRDLVVRAAVTDSAALADQIRKAVAAADPEVPLRRFSSMDQYLAESLALRRLTLILLAAFAMAALLLAATGVAAVLSHWVTQRTREIGLRLALGATRSQVLQFVMTRSLRLGITGIILGLIVALGSSRLLSRLLFGVRPTDLFTLTVVVTVLVVMALLASYLPARRASRTDPMTALRCE